MGLSNAAIIVIVLVACLAATALGASLFKHYKPADGETPFSPGYDQKVYMAEIQRGRATRATIGPPTYTEDTNYTKDTGSS
ncbi:hypothetical protein N7534_010212 [Penicillium rubens]|nr:hypothetical protein N7524_002496 [Penicillium chrysogenum]KAJ5846543.1 hypothetical protein N7534_010212 [Penicillium rubens]KAJ6152889.1 hypothetical protein N7497_007208 [Penicillium chrysogenum]